MLVKLLEGINAPLKFVIKAMVLKLLSRNISKLNILNIMVLLNIKNL